MITQQTLIWTALPNGLATVANPVPDGAAAQLLRLAVVVSPRLQPVVAGGGSAQLALFPDFLSWTQRVQQVAFGVELNDQLVPAELVKTELDAALWALLFPADTRVVPFVFEDYSNVRIRSYPAAHLHQYLSDLYTSVAVQHGVDMVPLPQGRGHQAASIQPDNPREVAPAPWDAQVQPSDPTRTPPEPLVLAQQAQAAQAQRARRLQLLKLQAGAVLTTPSAPQPSPENDLAKFQLFHEPVSPALTKLVAPQFDFHDVLALLSDHPQLLRQLGLTLELRVPLPPGLPAQGTVRVVPTWQPALGATTNATPRTQYTLASGVNPTFQAAARPTSPEVENGFLRLDPAIFSVVGLDVDGSLFKLENAEQNLASTLQSPVIGKPTAAGLPTLKSAGLALVQLNRASALVQDFAAASGLNAALGTPTTAPAQPVTVVPKPVLFAENLVRGYRVDVWDDQPKRWFSLCERVGEYRLLAADNHTVLRKLPLTEPAFVEVGATEDAPPSADPATITTLKLPESLFRWEGWSLAAPRPDDALALPTPSGPPTTPYRLDVAATARPGTLPRLRFGRSYRFRVRVVDLAGNSVPFNAQDSTTDHATPLVYYARYEPVAPPTLVMRAELTDGESAEHLVIRSNYDQPTAAYAQLNAVTGYPAANERHVAPPKTAQLMAETHGIFDEAMGLAPANDAAKALARQSTYRLARKEKGTFADTAIINTEDLLSVPDTLPATPEKLSVPGSSPPDTYVVHRTDDLRLPYLPDPLAVGAAFYGLPGLQAGPVTLPLPGQLPTPASPFAVLSTGPAGLLAPRNLAVTGPAQLVTKALPLPVLVPFAGAYPNLRPFRLRVVEGEGSPSYDATARVLTVPLEKARVCRVRMSCYLDRRGREQLGIWRWVRALAAVSSPPAGAAHPFEASDYGLQGRHWLLTPYREITLVHAVQQPLQAPSFQSLSATRGINFGIGPFNVTAVRLDGAVRVHGRSASKVDLVATWRETVDVPPAKPQRQFPDPAPPAGTPTPARPLLDERATRQAHVADLPVQAAEREVAVMAVQHEFGDTRYRRVSYEAVATSRFREYFLHPSLAQADFTRRSPAMELDVLSSARPPAPQVTQVLPTFRWVRNQGEGWRAHLRLGGGIRVYLARPWFASGEGEQLAVVLAKLMFTNIADADRLLVTQWAEDPIHRAGATEFTPVVQSFPGKSIELLPLPEYHGGKDVVGVVGHEVLYDADRDQWYSDLLLHTGSAPYFPFVRLALARYQRHSVPAENPAESVFLSAVVQAEFVQLAPSRSVSAERVSPTEWVLLVAGPSRHSRGADWATGNAHTREQRPNQLLAHVEQQRPGGSSDLNWAPVPDLPPKLLFNQPDPEVPHQYYWFGNLTVPAATATSRPYRLVVREWEENPGQVALPLLTNTELVTLPGPQVAGLRNATQLAAFSDLGSSVAERAPQRAFGTAQAQALTVSLASTHTNRLVILGPEGSAPEVLTVEAAEEQLNARGRVVFADILDLA